MMGVRSSFVLLAVLGAQGVWCATGIAAPDDLSRPPLAVAEEQPAPPSDSTLRQRAEDLARAASERFSEILGGRSQKVAQGAGPEATKDEADRGADEDVFAPVWGWLARAAKDYQDVIIAKLKNPSGDVVILAPPGTVAAQSGAGPTLPEQRAPELKPELKPALSWDSVMERVRDWLARANRSYRNEIVKKLVRPTQPEPPEAVTQWPPAEVVPQTAAPAPAPPPPPAAADAEAEQRAAEVRRAAEEAEAQRRAQAEAQRQPDQAEAKQAAEEAEAKRVADEAEAKRVAEQAEAKRVADEAEAKRKAEAEAEAEAKRVAEEAEATRKAEAKSKAEADARRMAEEAEAKRKADAEAEAKRLAEDAEAKRLADAAEAKGKAEAEAKRLAEDAEAKRLADAAEAKGKAEAEARRLAEEAEAKPKADAETAKRLAEEGEAERKAVAEAEAARLASEAEAKRAESAGEKPAEENSSVAIARASPPGLVPGKAPPAVEQAPRARREVVVSEPVPPKIAKRKRRVASAPNRDMRQYKRVHTRKHAIAHVAPAKRTVNAYRHKHHVTRPVPVRRVKVRKHRICAPARAYRDPSHRPGRVHVVRRGDTLSGIAQIYYGSGARFATIYGANRNKIKSPNLIYPRQRLYIPSGRR